MTKRMNMGDTFNADYLGGMKIKAIAEKHNCSISTVALQVRTRGLDRGWKGRRRTIPDNQEFRDLWCDADEPIKDIAKRYGVCGSSVAKASVRFGYPPRVSGRPAKKPPKKVHVEEYTEPEVKKVVITGIGSMSRKRIRRIIETGGRYAAIADLAKAWRCDMSHVRIYWNKAVYEKMV